jgi:hypothetical protein
MVDLYDSVNDDNGDGDDAMKIWMKDVWEKEG